MTRIDFSYLPSISEELRVPREPKARKESDSEAVAESDSIELSPEARAFLAKLEGDQASANAEQDVTQG